MIRIIEDLTADWKYLDERIEKVTDEIEALARADEGCQQLITVPGIGPIISSAMVAAIGNGAAPQYLVRDRDGIYGSVVTRRLRAMGIRDKPIAPASPWQNGFAERLIGSIRRECVDHLVVLGEAHLRRILRAYARYYNYIRTHRSLDKDAPLYRTVQRTGIVRSRAILTQGQVLGFE